MTTAASPSPASTTACRTCRADIKAELAALNLTAGAIPRPGRLEGAGRREGPHADRDDYHAADRRNQRHYRWLHRGGGQNRHSRPRPRQRCRSAWSGDRTRKIRDAFRAFVKARLPVDCTVEFANFADVARACSSPSTTRRSTKAREALQAEWGKKAVTVGAGGSIPIVGDFKSVLGHGLLHGRLCARRRPGAFAE